MLHSKLFPKLDNIIENDDQWPSSFKKYWTLCQERYVVSWAHTLPQMSEDEQNSQYALRIIAFNPLCKLTRNNGNILMIFEI